MSAPAVLASAWDRLRASDAERARALKNVVVLAWLVALVLAPRLWLSQRSYPTVPVWSALPALPWPADAAWYAALVALLALALLDGRRRRCSALFLALVGPLLLWDQSRWQVPVYQYLLLLLTLTVYPADTRGAARTVQITRVIIAATYFWSGVQKVNATFVHRVFPWVIGPVAAAWPEGARAMVLGAGLLVPPLEMAIGIGLLSRRYRWAAVLGAVVMHAAILLLLGPFGHRWDSFVWPWNVAMAAAVVILFGGAHDRGTSVLRQAARPFYGGLVVVLVGLMPALSFVNLWDVYLSWTMYSGNVAGATLRLSDTAAAGLPAGVRERVRRRKDGDNALSLMMWSFTDVGVEPYPEVRVFKRVARWVCGQTSDPTGIRLIVWERPSLLEDRRSTTTYTCGEM